MNINTINVVKCIDVKIFRTLMVRSTTKSYEKNFRKKVVGVMEIARHVLQLPHNEKPN